MIDLFGNEIEEDKPEPKVKALSFFDCLNALPRGNITPELLSVYNPYMINKAFSQSDKTVHLANLMNDLNVLPTEVQFNFYKLMGASLGRTKWAKKDANKILDDLLVFYDLRVAKDLLYTHTPEQIKELIKNLKKQKRNKNVRSK